MDGRIVQIALLGGRKAEIDLSKIMMKRLIHALLRARDLNFKKELAQSIEKSLSVDRLWPIPPCNGSEFCLGRAYKAHIVMEESQHIGKIVFNVSA